jgi:pimeloyl-ACP methyl ester carboxylesterase
MKHPSRRTRFIFASVVFLLALTTVAGAQATVTTKTGTLPDGATYLIEVPVPWNGTLLLYSHGYVAPGSPNPALDAGDPATHAFLLETGFALAGSSYAHTGWAIQEGLLDQMAVLDIFDTAVGNPRHTIAWGHSLGGTITAGLIQRNPQRFDAALPLCGNVAGSVGTWNQALDFAFAFKTLLAPNSPLELTNIINPLANLALSESILAAAGATPQGQARLALAAAVGDIPGWFDPASPEPAASDFAAQVQNQFLWAKSTDLPFVFALRAEVEVRAAGNPSWNTGVDYRRQLQNSVDRNEVIALYAAAGLNLEHDLETLNQAPRITANPASVAYLEQNIVFNGNLNGVPVLTMHTKGDGLVTNQQERAYMTTVREAGNGRFLRELFVHRAGHCAMTPAEQVTALSNLIFRMDTGFWPDLNPNLLSVEAGVLGPLNVAPPSFFRFQPKPFLRPLDTFTEQEGLEDHERRRDAEDCSLLPARRFACSR